MFVSDRARRAVDDRSVGVTIASSSAPRAGGATQCRAARARTQVVASSACGAGPPGRGALYSMSFGNDLDGCSMKWQMNENSLFAVLLRSSWMISAAIAVAIGALAYALLPEAYRVVGTAGGLPFLVIAGMAGWKQFQAPSAARVTRTLEAVGSMSWIDFAAALEQGYRRDGCEVSRVSGAVGDFEVRRGWRTSLVSAKRWKAGRTGVEPLRELLAAKEAREAHECIYIAIGEVSDNARAFAVQHGITLMGGPELARLLPDAGRGR